MSVRAARELVITVAAWTVHAVIYPAFTMYVWCVLPGARAFEAFLAAMIIKMESLRDAQLDTLEHARV